MYNFTDHIYIPSASKLQQSAHIFHLVYRRMVEHPATPGTLMERRGDKFIVVQDAEHRACNGEAPASFTLDV